MTSRKKSIAFITLGCKANRYDTGAMMSLFGEDYEVSAPADAGSAGPADIYVINTCAVTGKSAYQCRQMIRRAKKANPDALVAVTGCLVEIAPDSLKEAGADIVAGLDLRGALKENIEIMLSGRAALSESGDHSVFFAPDGGVQSRGRALIKIQDGCDHNCAYCVVTIARGDNRSVPVEGVLGQLRAATDAGYREAVLTGVHIGLYGKDRGGSLTGLMRKIAVEEGMPERIRLSSIEPGEITPELVEIVANSGRFCPHFHVPLQSGDKDILKSMGRPYTPDIFRKALDLIAQKIDNPGIGLDVIAGFPGETEEAHRNTVELIKSSPSTYLHVFPMSVRPGTRAESMPDKVPSDVIKSCARELRELGARLYANFLERQKGKTLGVLVERCTDGKAEGTSGNYARVTLPGSDKDIGELLLTKIKRAGKRTLHGERE